MALLRRLAPHFRGPSCTRSCVFTTRRLQSSTAQAVAPPLEAGSGNKRLLYGTGFGFLACSAIQALYGQQKDFYEYRYITDKDPDDLAGFFGGEEFMQVFGARSSILWINSNTVSSPHVCCSRSRTGRFSASCRSSGRS